MPLHRFWIQFLELPSDVPAILRVGCGVTAFDEADCLALLSRTVFTGDRIPTVKSIARDVDISTLDARHIRPNMGNPAVRGVWFPLGYAL